MFESNSCPPMRIRRMPAWPDRLMTSADGVSAALLRVAYQRLLPTRSGLMDWAGADNVRKPATSPRRISSENGALVFTMWPGLVRQPDSGSGVGRAKWVFKGSFREDGP